ncbi:pseudaminic acid cytidylyltransferase [Sphingobacterium composti Ten et al. 2007 non Yoo et al. 2007]|uniref:pseudaminic acid cytidylyltransferase n=1 Tax=Sphingobacterium composti TaxID=363260 RepID=UPI0019155E65|nr:pseudaminic acid cytidylyltransferase [Sphingobacterium composti Ten et al. 2007 non Yoo et al. 2007]
MKNNICIIPARGGSKRIPRKNIKDFLGKPIIAYSIKAALESGIFSEVMVSTDDIEIGELAIKYGAKVPFYRSGENSNDYATTLDVLREVIEWYEWQNEYFDNICCIYPTAPFVTVEKLNFAIDLLTHSEYDSVVPIVQYSFPIQRSFVLDTSHKVSYKFPSDKNARSQDLEATYHDCGQFYLMHRKVLDKDSIVTSNTGAILCTELEVQDIDNEIDWKLAELKYELLQGIK